MQSSSEALIPQHQLVKIWRNPCENAAIRSSRCDASACDTSYDWRSERSTTELGAETDHESYFYRNDSTFGRNHEFKRYSFPRVHNGQPVTSFFDSPPGHPSQYQRSIVPEHPMQMQPYEHSFHAISSTEPYTRTQATARDSHTNFDMCRDVQLRQQHEVSASEIGVANADAKSVDCDFSRERLRKVLLHGLMQDSDCIKDYIKGWNDDTACTVT
eukprot:TRINITY_DN19863_c0_g1_i1.p1 TRINITY_DN19863_c0_g1~~TRINITY_DN19863_c0_g1_i1.p1  ORF type:complete len:235 (+),score=19.18 TRINITY_DN19863_c0_g1_i1:63-707(+)